MTKITKKDVFTAVANYFDTTSVSLSIGNKGTLSADDLADFFEHEIELVNRKNSGSGKPTAKQVENEVIKEIILETLRDYPNGLTVTDLQKANDKLGGYQNQKLSAILRLMIKEGTVIREIDKRKPIFRKA